MNSFYIRMNLKKATAAKPERREKHGHCTQKDRMDRKGTATKRLTWHPPIVNQPIWRPRYRYERSGETP